MGVNFWNDLEDFFCLAPMEDVTDTVFREMVINNSDDHSLKVLFTEFLSTDGFCHEIGRSKVIHRLKVNQSEEKLLRKKGIKLVAQIWGTDPEKFEKTAEYISKTGQFDGIDINMGCPQKNIIKKGACSALILNPDLAKEIIIATSNATHLPVSVKTRVGFKQLDTLNWTAQLLNTPISALTIHGRTQKQMSEGKADWNEIQKVSKLRDEINPQVKIIGNGDVHSVSEGKINMQEFECNGVMVGRGVFSDFWMFANSKESIGIEEKLEAMIQHASLFNETWEHKKPWVILRRFFKIYTSNLPQAAKLRDMVMRTNNYQELMDAIQTYKHQVGIQKNKQVI